MSGSGPPTSKRPSESPGSAGQMGEVYEVRLPDGRRFDIRRKVTERQGQLLVDARICHEVRSPTGILRYFKMHRTPPVKKFACFLAAANLTTIQTGNLYEHISSKRKGL
jgi:hypothetical protein